MNDKEDESCDKGFLLVFRRGNELGPESGLEGSLSGREWGYRFIRMCMGIVRIKKIVVMDFNIVYK